LRVARQVVRLLETIGRPVNGAVEIVLSRQELAQMDTADLGVETLRRPAVSHRDSIDLLNQLLQKEITVRGVRLSFR